MPSFSATGRTAAAPSSTLALPHNGCPLVPFFPCQRPPVLGLSGHQRTRFHIVSGIANGVAPFFVNPIGAGFHRTLVGNPPSRGRTASHATKPIFSTGFCASAATLDIAVTVAAMAIVLRKLLRFIVFLPSMISLFASLFAWGGDCPPRGFIAITSL